MSPSPPAGAPSSPGDQERGPTAEAGYDPDLVVAAARGRDPGLPADTARELAVHAWDHLRAAKTPDAAELARRLLADHPRAGATAANVVAVSAVELCAERGVDLG